MFSVNKVLTGESLPLEYIKAADGESPVLGQALKTSAGLIAKASGTDTPELICAGVKQSDGTYPVLRIRDDIEFYVDTPLTSADLGKKVTLSSDGKGITSTAGGNFRITADGIYGSYGYFN